MSKNLFARMTRVINEVRKQHDGMLMSMQTFEVFLAVAAKDGISSNEIHKLTGIASPSVSRAIGDLGDWARRRNSEGPKLIRTERDINDKRHMNCFLTDKGKRLANLISMLMDK